MTRWKRPRLTGFFFGRMLYDFHRSENAKKAQSVNATYVITGVQKPPEKPATNGHAKDGEDEVMQSSPFMSSMPQPEVAEEEIRTTSMILVREEDLEGRILICFL